MASHVRGQRPLFPIKTRPVPPALLFSGDAATRSETIRRLRARARSVQWATFCAQHIDGWPDRSAAS